jgi:hypothetical protein
MEGYFDRFCKIYTEYMAVSKLMSIDEKLSCKTEIKSDTSSLIRYRTARKYGNDPVKIKKRNL